ncbi:MAG: hypothetical protein WD712_00420 [Candidatus Spechtbacterales bacterium]
MNFKRILPLFFVLGLLFAPIFSNTAESAGISVSPLTFEFGANPGDNVSNLVKVFNTTDEQILVTMDIENFVATGEEGKVAIDSKETNAFSLAQWIVVEPATFVVPPHEFVPVEFTINVPLNAEPGGHYASILASSGGQPVAGGSAVVQKVGSLVLLQVAGEVDERMNIESVDAPDFSEYGPVVISSRFRNTGSVHLKPRGFITITNILGNEVAKLNLEQKNVLPDSIRKIDTEFDGGFLFGKYTATLTAIYGSKNEPLSYTTSFWVIPWKPTVAVGAGVLVLLFILYIMRKRLALAFKILLKGHKV